MVETSICDKVVKYKLEYYRPKEQKTEACQVGLTVYTEMKRNNRKLMTTNFADSFEITITY